ncbi:MAG: carbohydrate porin [Planctomycetota bacterium]
MMVAPAASDGPARLRSSLALAALLAAMGAATAQAVPAGQDDKASPQPPESVDSHLAEAASRPAGIFKYGPVSLIDPYWKQLDRALDDYGVNLGLAYTAVYQGATKGPGEREAAGGDADLFGNWRLLGEDGGESSSCLYFAVEHRHAITTEIAPGSLDNEIGSLWGTTNGFGEQDLALKELFWQQQFDGDRLLFCVGKLDAENYYNTNYLQSDSKYFLNQAFSSFPVRAFPGTGLGMNAMANLADWLYVSTGFQDAQGRKTVAGFDTFFGDFNLFSALELGLRSDLEGLGRGTYRLTG